MQEEPWTSSDAWSAQATSPPRSCKSRAPSRRSGLDCKVSPSRSSPLRRTSRSQACTDFARNSASRASRSSRSKWPNPTRDTPASEERWTSTSRLPPTTPPTASWRRWPPCTRRPFPTRATCSTPTPSHTPQSCSTTPSVSTSTPSRTTSTQLRCSATDCFP